MTSDATEPVARARRIADDVLAPAAQDVDRAATVPRSHLDALADAGLFGLAGPADAGGFDAPPPVARRAIAAIGGGCGATFFVWVQHHGVVRNVRATQNTSLRAEVLEPLCRGDRIAGTAFAHARRPGPAALRATRVDGGWRLDGHVPWATSWGVADHFAVAAVDGDTLVWLLMPGPKIDGSDVVRSAVDGVSASPLALPVFGATATVEVSFDGCVLGDDRWLASMALDDWRRADRRRASLGQPATLGIADRAVRLLGAIEDDDARRAADVLGHRIVARWERDDALGDLLAGDTDVIADASEHRAACLDLAQRATTALLAAVGGRGMSLDHPAQRLAREASFYVIQAQTADGRAATLRSVT